MHNVPTTPSQHLRQSLLVPGLLLGAIATLCLIGTTLDHYSAIKDTSLAFVSGKASFWPLVLAALACWAMGYGSVLAQGRQGLAVTIPATAMNAVLLLMAMIQLQGAELHTTNQLVFFWAALALPFLTYGEALLFRWIQRQGMPS